MVCMVSKHSNKNTIEIQIQVKSGSVPGRKVNLIYYSSILSKINKD